MKIIKERIGQENGQGKAWTLTEDMQQERTGQEKGKKEITAQENY